MSLHALRPNFGIDTDIASTFLFFFHDHRFAQNDIHMRIGFDSDEIYIGFPSIDNGTDLLTEAMNVKSWGLNVKGSIRFQFFFL